MIKSPLKNLTSLSKDLQQFLNYNFYSYKIIYIFRCLSIILSSDQGASEKVGVEIVQHLFEDDVLVDLAVLNVEWCRVALERRFLFFLLFVIVVVIIVSLEITQTCLLAWDRKWLFPEKL